ncbi:MAG: hypothetical protein V7609_2051 [Verrucomicrobiota bacterium]
MRFRLFGIVVLCLQSYAMHVRAAETNGLFVVLEIAKNHTINYQLNGRKCSKEEFVKLAEITLKTYSGARPIVLFDDRLSLADVGNVGGLIGAIGFPVPRYFMFTEKKSRVVEVNLAETTNVFDYEAFVRDPFATVAGKQD